MKSPAAWRFFTVRALRQPGTEALRGSAHQEPIQHSEGADPRIGHAASRRTRLAYGIRERQANAEATGKPPSTHRGPETQSRHPAVSWERRAQRLAGRSHADGAGRARRASRQLRFDRASGVEGDSCSRLPVRGEASVQPASAEPTPRPQHPEP